MRDILFKIFIDLFILLVLTWSAREKADGHEDKDHAAIRHPEDSILQGQIFVIRQDVQRKYKTKKRCIFYAGDSPGSRV